MDIVIAKKIFNEEDFSLVIVKDEKVLLKSNERGIKPIYDIVKVDHSEYINASAADKVVGRGAAIVYDILKIKNLYAELISESALEFLKDTDIVVEYDKKVENIRNRDNTDLCPMEKLSMGILDGNDFIAKVDDFFEKISGGK